MRSFINMISTSAVLFGAHKDQGSPAFDAQKEVDKVNATLAQDGEEAADKELNSLTAEQREKTVELGLKEEEASDAAQDGDDSSEGSDLGADEDGANAEQLDDLNA